MSEIELIKDHAKAIVQNIAQVEMALLELPQVSCPVIHRFGPGIYMREVTIPAGSLAIGHRQKTEHLNVFLKGRITVLNDDGTTSDLQAPMIFTAKPGRKIGFALEDVVWMNIYATNETDVEKLEEMFLDKSEGWMSSEAERLEGFKRKIDQDDFLLACKELGVSPETVRAMSENTDDMTDLPFGGYKIKVGKSLIEGRGLIATADIDLGEVIAPARIGGKRTIAGRFTNHSKTPNAKMVWSRHCPNDIGLIALKKISGCHGGRDGEEITVDYRESVRVAKMAGGVACQV